MIAKEIIIRMKKGDLITSPKDKRKFLGFAANIEDGVFEKIFTAEEIGNMLPNEFVEYEQYINNQLETYGILREYQAQVKILSGEFIYVNSYTRFDGTEVSGYYRRK